MNLFLNELLLGLKPDHLKMLKALFNTLNKTTIDLV